ncbi:hypothetical protein VV01_09070 [Luteipulveratus halotolerans]|uniref:Acyltransferase 3 domain-containing protein n=2 Tax=Luteipulveratus halotolerans TaxID=1631356 RepID=A0A0L6CI19_9MICO|nr:hypothetical protein VV01_09070 [Luteipulveratus halotolerans]
MLTFMAFHLGVLSLQGAWVGINLFFVLSGFLITRLLIEERVDYGHIDVLGFYRRRARRLLPGLMLLLATLCAYGVVWASDDVRRGLRADLLATLGYVMNWRLILRDDQYFETFGNPSFLRHAWTLSVEEQFYVVVPLLVSALFVLRGRRAQTAVVLALAVVSAAWTSVVGLGGVTAQAHAYYGTDTRVQSLLVGVGLAFGLGLRRRGRRPRPLPRAVVTALGWGGLGALVVAYVAVPPLAGWMFDRGGILLTSAAAAALVTACADPRPSVLTSALGLRPIAYLGKLSYGLYLWHWPIHLWLAHAVPDMPTWLHVVAGMVVTTGVAATSYELVERPVLRAGVRGLVPTGRRGSRLVMLTSVVALVAASFAVGRVPASATPVTSAPAVQLVPGAPAYVPGRERITFGLFGDSVPEKLLENRPPRYSDLAAVGLTDPGCDLTDLPRAGGNPKESLPTPRCLALKQGMADAARSGELDVVVLMTGTVASLPHLIDGRAVGVEDPRYEGLVVAALERMRRDARAGGAQQVQVVTVPCRDRRMSYLPDSYRAYLDRHPSFADAGADPVVLNRLITRWAGENDVPVLDLYGALGCAKGFTARRHGIDLYGDGVHFSPEATPMIWTWLAPAIRSAYQQRAGAGS